MNYDALPPWVPTIDDIEDDGKILDYVDIASTGKNKSYFAGLSSSGNPTVFYNISLQPTLQSPINPSDGSVWWDGSDLYLYSEITSAWVNVSSSASSDKTVEYFVGDTSVTDLTMSVSFMLNSTEVYLDGVLCYPKTTETEALESSTGVTYWDYEEISNTTIQARNVWPSYSRIAVYYRPS